MSNQLRATQTFNAVDLLSASTYEGRDQATVLILQDIMLSLASIADTLDEARPLGFRLAARDAEAALGRAVANRNVATEP